MVRIDSLCKEFNGKNAVSSLTFSLSKGEIYGLIGPNGAGKTTTFRMIAGLLTPTSGEISLDDQGARVVDPRERRRRIGYLTGATGLYPRLRVREQLEYFGRLYGMPDAALPQRTQTLATSLGFLHLLDRRCEHLSTGERQRVSIGRALFHDPALLVLDEPTAGLDVLASRVALDAIRSARASGCAVLFSTHYLSEADLLCDRVGLLHKGRLIFEGTPSEVRTHAGTHTLEEAFLRLTEAPATA